MFGKWRINILPLVGVIIGMVAIFSVWYSVHDGGLLPLNQPERDYNLIDAATLEHPSFIGGQIWIIGAWLFITGTIIAILSPLGGIIQMIGLWMGPFIGVGISQGVYGSVWPSFLAMVSSIICCISIVKPFGLNYSRRPLKLKDRLLTFGKIEKVGSAIDGTAKKP